MLDAALGASIRVEFGTDRPAVTNYSVVLVVAEDAGSQTIRVYDGTHGVNEMHRYARGAGKQPAEVFHAGTLGEGMRAAMRQIESSYEAMIASWRQG